MREYYISNNKDLAVLRNDITKIILKGFTVKIIAKKICDEKSTQQLGYYWGVVLPVILKQLYADGYTKADYNIERLHTELKTMFFYEENVLPKSETIARIPKSLASANIDEMREYLDNIIVWAASNGIEIPEPIYPECICDGGVPPQ